MSKAPSHEALVETMTGGMVSSPAAFAGSAICRPDGKPSPELRAELRSISDLRNLWACLSSLALPIAVLAGVFYLDHWVATLATIPIMGVVQNRMFVLHHEGAHRLLFSNRRLNDFLGVTIFGWLSFGTGTHAYRRVHAHHHRDEFGPKEPDFLLYALYPITRESMRRKLRRDSTGVSAYRALRPRLTGLFHRRYWANSFRFYLGQLIVFSLFTAFGHPWAYLFLWVLPFATAYQVLNRLRGIAEHGGMTRSLDRRNTAHHVNQGLIARVILVPHCVGHHLAHHVDSGIPFRNLPKLTRILEEEGYITPEITWPNYRSLWKELFSGGHAK